MRILQLLFGRKTSGENTSREASVEPRIMVSESEPFVLAFLSSKGGCGKSVISANTVVLFSVFYKSVVAVDMDIVNATLTNMLLAATPEVLKEDDGVSTIDYIVEGPERYQLYKLEFPPKRRFNIQVAGKKDLGVAAGDIYVLPAKKATLSYERRLSELAYMSREEVRDSLVELYTNIVNFARTRKARFVILDFPPLRPDQRKVFEGVFVILEQIPNFIMVSSFDYAAVHGLISILNQRYSFLKPRTRAFLINMAVPNTDAAARIKSYIETIYGEGFVHFIRRDPRWSQSIVPPIVLGDPSKGAHADLIASYVKIGLLRAEDVKEKLRFDPITRKLIH